MFLPIGDTPNPKGFTPYVTWAIIAANIVVFLVVNLPLASRPADINNPMLVNYIQLLVDHGLPLSQIRNIVSQTSALDIFLYTYGYKPGAPDIVSLFTSLFLHSGFWHIFGNMLFLYIYGDNVENQLGRIRFLLMYLVTGIIATLSFSFLAGNSMTPLVGASGAISGVLGCYFLMFPKNKIKVFILLFPIFINVVKIPARIVLAIFVLLDNLLPLLLQTGGSVAHGAHLGGFCGGLAIAAWGEYRGWGLPSEQKHSRTQENREPETEIPVTFIQRFTSALHDKNPDMLTTALMACSAAELATLSQLQLIAAIKFLKEKGRYTAAGKIIKNAISARKGTSTLARLYYELGDIRFRQGLSTAAYQHLLTGLDLNPDGETEAAIRQLLGQIEH